MEHAGHHEETEKIGSAGAHALLDGLVILHAHHGVQGGVGPAEIHQDLAATLLEAGEIGVGGIQYLVDSLEPGGVRIQIELVDVILRIGLAERHVAEEIHGEVCAGGGGAIVDDPGIPAAASALAGDFSADGPGGKYALAGAGDFSVEFVERADLGRREAIGLVGAGFAFGQISRGLEIAAARIVDDAVLQSVLRVAGIVDFGGQRR